MYQMSNVHNGPLKDIVSHIASTPAKSNIVLLNINFLSSFLYSIVLINKCITNLLIGKWIHNEYN